MFIPQIVLSIAAATSTSQAAGASNEPIAWPNGARTAVSLSYDDAIDSHLDHAVPALDKFGLKASFYMVMSSDSLRRRFDEWRALAGKGHELGNHTIYHACSGSLPDRDWVEPHNDMDTRTVPQMQQEVRTANTFLHAIDGRSERSFAPPCGDLYASGENYLPAVESEFVAIRGEANGMPADVSVGFGPVDVSGEELIAFVKENTRDGMLVHIVFHGVGGDYLAVSAEAHEMLLEFLAGNADDYWVDTYLNIMQHVKEHR